LNINILIPIFLLGDSVKVLKMSPGKVYKSSILVYM